MSKALSYPRGSSGNIFSTEKSKPKNPPKVHAFYAAWAGGIEAFEKLVNDWWRKEKFFDTHKLKPWSEDTMALFNAFVRIRKKAGDQKQTGSDLFLDVKPQDMFWWLNKKPNIGKEVSVSERQQKRGFRENHKVALQLVAYADFVLQNRQDKQKAITYEERAQNVDVRPWSGSLVTQIVTKAAVIKNREGSGTELSGKHFEEASIEVFNSLRANLTIRQPSTDTTKYDSGVKTQHNKKRRKPNKSSEDNANKKVKTA